MHHSSSPSVDAALPGRINFFPWSTLSGLPLILQTEIAECGIACLAMISSYHGGRVDLADLRARLGMAPDGLTLKHLMIQAERLGLSAQTVRAELASLKHLRTPCVLHWGLNHFVVLKKAGPSKIVVHDPQLGMVTLTYPEASEKFTGYAVEFQPNQQFETRDERKTPTLRSIIGRTHGLGWALTHILCMALLLEALSLISPAVMQWLIDNGLSSGDRSLIITVVAGMGLMMIISLTVGTIRSWMVMYLSVSVGFQWSSRILTHLLHLPVDFFERRNLGDVISRFGSVSAIQQTVTTGVIEGILDGLVGIVTLVMIWLYSPALAMTAVGTLVALILLQLLTFEKMKRIGNESLIADARVSSNLLESIRGIRTLKLAGLANQRRMSWQKLSIEAINVKVRQQWMSIAIGTTSTLISSGQRLLAIFLAATMIAEGRFTVGMLFAYLSYQDQFMSGTGGLVQLYFRFKMLRLHFERLSDIVLTPPEQLNYLATTDEGSKPEPSMGALYSSGGSSAPSVEFRGVSFKYSEFARQVVSDLSFSSVDSRCTVITGRTGIGKTTIFKLILGIYLPESGQILINGKPIGTMLVDELRREISSVLKDDVLFAGSIRDNIALFDSDLDQAWVEECARIACLHEDIQQMTMGYHTLIGDMGSTLSAGQKQRVLIARALYRKPKILLLDEATSDLDIATEEQLNINLSKLDLHRIYIAHRPQTIKFGDRVVHLEG